MATDALDDDGGVLDRLFEEMARRFRAGEWPTLEEYERKYPEHAVTIREIFPAVEAIERTGQKDGEPTEAFAPKLDGSAIPKRLGEYKLVREVGRGGMGIVYEAVQESLERRVAVKVLPPGASHCQLQRFELEARTAAQLHHTHIVPVFAVGKQEEINFYAMEFIEGEGLDKVIDELRIVRDGNARCSTAPVSEETKTITQELLSGAFAIPESSAGDRSQPASAARPGHNITESEQAASVGVRSSSNGRSSAGLTTHSDTPFYRGVATIGMHVAESLTYAHRQNVLHRDIKPSNLMLDTSGHVWVTDFGLAKVEGISIESTGAVGTLYYMPPERFRGVSLPQSDIYSLGATLYEMLTLDPPFKDSSQERLMQRILREEPRRPRRTDGRIPRDLETICLMCLMKEPERRYKSAHHLAEDLECYLSDRPLKYARRASALEQVWRWCLRNPAMAALSAMVLLLLLLVAFGASYVAIQSRNESEMRRQQQEREDALGALSKSQFQVRSDPTLATDTKERRRLTFGTYESDSAEKLAKEFTPALQLLANDIARRTKQAVDIQVYIFQTYEMGQLALSKRLMDFGRAGPVSYVLVKGREPDVRLLAMDLQEGQKRLTAKVFVRDDSPIQNMKDLVGKKVAFGDKDSTSSTVFFKAELMKFGIKASTLEKFDYHLGQDDVVEAVRSGKSDAGCVRKSMFDREWNATPVKLREIRTIEGGATRAWIARPDLPQATFDLIQESLVALSDQAVLKSSMKVTGFAPTNDDEYDSVRAVMKEVEGFDR